MAEIVQQRIEDRIPELEQLERVGLFTKKEVKSIIKRVTALEYKLTRLIVNKEDFIAYIQYEINVLELIKKRRAHIHYQFKREEIEYPIIHRINSTFRRATNKWKDDVQLWLSHVAFCKKWATKGQISKVFSSMLAIHPDKPALWIMAAKSELEDRNSSESARHLFLRSLRFHPNNQKVYQEYFRMELLHSEKLRKQQKDLEKAEMDLGEYEFSPEILRGKLAEVVYRNATGQIKEAAFVISLLNIAAIFDFTKELQDTILQDLQTNYTEDSFTWDFMAKRELEAPGAGEELQTAKGRASDINRREERCCQVYEEGVKSLNSGKSSPIHSEHVHSIVFKNQILRLDSVVWILRNIQSRPSELHVAMTATRRYSQSVSMWSLSLQTLIQLGSGDIGKHFQDALTNVNPKVYIYIYINVHRNTHKLCPHNVFILSSKALQTVCSLVCSQRGLLSAVAAVAMETKESYLDWSYSTGGYKKARKTFTSCLFFQETPKMHNLRDCYERVLQEFGTTDDDLWLQYIQEELGPLGQPENCGKIHWRAMKFLEGESVERFTSKYTLLQTGHL
uniref:UTP6 small subunit processome component n=1 Tax=Amphiprion ocellaris TaxID=80972 RepID=A0AAQ5YNB5_AMPOC